MCSCKKLKEQLPNKERFYNSLADKKNSDKDHELNVKVWDKSEMKTLKDYHNFYLKCDILL